MTTTPATLPSLDPDDWESFRELGHAMLDDAIDYLRDVRERPAWQSPSAEARAALASPVPRRGRALAEVYEDFKRHVLPYPTGNIHPRFWGWVMGTGTPAGLLAEMLGGAMNCHVSGYDQGASVLEHQVVRWLAELMDFPADASGLLVSGGTMANLLGVAVARSAILGNGAPACSVHGGGQPVFYGSEQTHGWAGRAADLMGMGEAGFRTIAVDADHRIALDQLRAAIAEDRGNGLRPFCINGNAGTVSCGATDDLHALADIAEGERLWFHVDGAFGAMAKLSTRHRELVDGLERANSIAFDLHKWGYMQYELAAILVRDAEAHEEAFRFAPSYLETFGGGIAVDPTEFASRGLQLSRGFRSLKLWMQLAHYGADRIGALIDQNIDQVSSLRSLVRASPRLEQLGPSAMNVLCFRYVPENPEGIDLDDLNREILVRVQESGLAVPSNGRIDGRFAIRVANTNHRTRSSDFELLVEAVIGHGAALVAGGPIPDLHN